MPAYGKVKVDTITYDLSGTATDVSVANIATKASPTFTGTVTVPTASANDNSTKAASTAYVQTELGDYALKAAPTFTGTVNAADLVLSGDLTVQGTTTTIDTTTLQVEDKNIEIGKVSTPSDVTADGGGWTLKGATDKTFNWVNATDAWTSSEHIHLLDSKKALLGTDSDLQVYHSGSHGYITEGTGNLKISVADDNDVVQILKGSSENIAQFTAHGSCELYHDNSKKLETTSGGVTVTGTLAATAVTGDGSGLTNLPPAGNTVDLVADGAIAAGKPVIIKSNGKAEQVKSIITARNTTSASISHDYGISRNLGVATAWDTSRDRAIFVAQYTINIGTISTGVGTNTFSLGGGTTYNSAADHPAVLFNPDDNITYIAFRDTTNNYGKIFGGTPSGNTNDGWTNSSGGTFTFNSASTDNIVLLHDSANDKIIICFQDSDNAFKAIVATVGSNGALTFGSKVSTGISKAGGSHMGACYDSTAGKIVMCMADGSSSSKGVTAVGTISGTSISFTNTNDFEANEVNYINMAYHATENKVLVTFRDWNTGGNTKRFSMRAGTLSGTTVTWDTMQTYPGGWDGSANNIAVCPQTDRVIVSFLDDSNKLKWTLFGMNSSGYWNNTGGHNENASQSYSNHWPNVSITTMGNYGRAIVFVVNGSEGNDPEVLVTDTGQSGSNLGGNSNNVVGFAAAAINDGASGTINTYGNTVDHQSGLSAGSSYYIQNDGTLTSGASGTVFGGLALSATKLLIQRGG